jgi:hypothetical protein
VALGDLDGVKMRVRITGALGTARIELIFVAKSRESIWP